MTYALIVAAIPIGTASWLCFESPVDRVLGVACAASWFVLLVLL